MIGNATRRTIIGAAAGAAVIAMSRAAPAQTPLRVIVFATLSNLAQFAAQSQNFAWYLPAAVRPAPRAPAPEAFSLPARSESPDGHQKPGLS